MGTVPISVLGSRVLDRLEEDQPPNGPVFWNLSTEIYSGIVEAINDLTILVGRPNVSFNVPFTLAANTVWQSLPSGQFLITDIQGPSGGLRKVSLFSMDYVQASWDGSWENDVATEPRRWFPVGLTKFGIHPAVAVPITVILSCVPYPVTSPWPYDGTQTVPFHDEFFEAIEMYAAHYARLKETGLESEEAVTLFQQYMKMAERLTEIEDKKDSIFFSRSWGGRAGLNPIQKR